jgi:hypothetical protein
MESKAFDLAIAYRIYPKVSKVPPVYADDKLRLSELCLRSLRASLGDLKIKMFVLLDNCPPEYAELFKKYFSDDELELVPLDGIGNRPTFELQMKYLLEQEFSENIYFAEDDYFYLPDTFKEMIDFVQEKDVDFVSPYDHLDYYEHPLHYYGSEIKVTPTRHWRTVSATTMTFLTTKTTLRKSRHIFNTYLKRNLDSSLWMSATKYQVRNPMKMLGICKANRKLCKNLKKSWVDGWGWIQLMFRKQYKLWSPMPSLATHMENRYLAPTIEWQEHFEATIKAIEEDKA